MPRRKPDLSGSTFGRLFVIRLSGRDSMGRAFYECRCSCGTEKVLSRTKLITGTRSCGCLIRDTQRALKLTHGMTRTPEYLCWQNMRHRCDCPDSKDYDSYGGRGIKVCERWSMFENFIADMGSRPSKKHTIERLDSNGDYTPDNCTWETMSMQNRNKRNNVIIEWNGQKKCLSDWAKELGMYSSSLAKRLKKWPKERAMTERKAAIYG